MYQLWRVRSIIKVILFKLFEIFLFSFCIWKTICWKWKIILLLALSAPERALLSAAVSWSRPAGMGLEDGGVHWWPKICRTRDCPLRTKLGSGNKQRQQARREEKRTGAALTCRALASDPHSSTSPPVHQLEARVPCLLSSGCSYGGLRHGTAMWSKPEPGQPGRWNRHRSENITHRTSVHSWSWVRDCKPVGMTSMYVIVRTQSGTSWDARRDEEDKSFQAEGSDWLSSA